MQPAKTWLGVVGITFAAFMAVLDVQIVNTSLNNIAASLDASPEKASWLMTAYLTAEVVAIPLMAVVVQRLGLRNTAVTVITLFACFSLACARAWDFSSMIAFRALQGLAGGTMIPLALNGIMSLLPKEKRPIGMSLFAIAATCAPTLGPVLGGWLTEHHGWQWIFYINLVPAIVLVMAVLNGISVHHQRSSENAPVDKAGILLLLPALAALEVFLEEGNSHDWFDTPWITAAAIIAITGLIGFCLCEARTQKPLVNLSLLRIPGIPWCYWAIFGLGMALYGSIFLIAQYHARVQGFTPMHIAQILLWMGIPQLIILPFMPGLTKILPAELCVMVGFLLFLAGTLMNTPLTIDFAGEHFYLNQIIRAIGQPFIFVPLSLMVTRHVPAAEAASASILVDIFLAIGGASGIALLSTLLDRSQDHFYHGMSEASVAHTCPDQLTTSSLIELADKQSLIMAYSQGFWLICAFILFAMVCVVLSWFFSRAVL
ncbi:DHA2 family efflux MFS transporter permease subunit [Endozoicomonas sp. ONNA2]|uniref:DHA2 family efflux MFS transporter permease subunit n=1 Tax=Endozoicomonas sp. ONNA2 TaxID=2828741 RepID=UPI0021477EDC|nr:DHA2 family efflux MFS transporter permease subunit [Endozoicomonas sp. ONNA2]